MIPRISEKWCWILLVLMCVTTIVNCVVSYFYPGDPLFVEYIPWGSLCVLAILAIIPTKEN